MKRVLVIDDNKEIRENTAELLALHGYFVLTASNGREGYNQALDKHPDVVLCDIMMPDSDGKVFFRLIKQDDNTRSIPLIFFSADSGPSEVKRGLIKGAERYLSKPFTEEELLEAIRYCTIESV
jgi:CheY-like chemotaxis protein